MFMCTAAAVAHASTLRDSPAAATVDPDQVGRNQTPPEPPSSEREPASAAFPRLNQQLDSIGKRPGALLKPFTRSRAFPGEAWSEQKGSTSRKPRRLCCGASSASPPHARTLALADVCASLSRRFASVGHTGAPMCPSASPKASRHLTEARNKVEKCCCLIIGRCADQVTPSRTGFQRGGGACACARARLCARPLISRLSPTFNHVSYPASAANFCSITSD